MGRGAKTAKEDRQATPARARLRQRVLSGEPVLGTFVELPEPALVEILGRAGLDFAILDLEHAGLTPSAVPNLVRAADVVGLPLFARLPTSRLADVTRLLDSGVVGILAAGVRTAAEAAEVAAACRFPPHGARGACLGIRSTEYGWEAWPTYLARAHDETIVGVAVEGPEGIAAVGDIIATPGVDFVFVGVFDLSNALGHPGDLGHTDVVDALRTVSDSARRGGRAFSTWAPDNELGRQWVSLGVTVLTISTDVLLWRDACLRLVGGWR